MVRTADGQPAQQGRRKKRITGKLLGDRLRQLAELDAKSREGIVAEDYAVLADHDERRGDLSPGILAGLVVKIAVELRRARVERCPVVGGIERLYPILTAGRRSHREASFWRYSQAALRNTAPGSAELRIAFAKASVSLAVKTNMARLSIVRSAADTAL